MQNFVSKHLQTDLILETANIPKYSYLATGRNGGVFVVPLLMSMPFKKRLSPRNEYREQEGLRLQGSPTLARKFKALKSLTARVQFFNARGVPKTGEMKCQYNLETAKSFLRFDCPNPECVGGDFELTELLAAAVSKRRTTISGELPCKGWRDKSAIGTIHCDSKMHYKIPLAYGRIKSKKPAAMVST